MSVLVLILEGDSKKQDGTIPRLQRVFSDPYFVTQVFTPDKGVNFNLAYRQALTYAASGPFVIDAFGNQVPTFQYRSMPCLIVLDTSVSNLEPGQMASYVQIGLSYSPDLLYLTHWLDSCGKYKTVLASVLGGSALKQTFEPTATQCICFSTVARDSVINSLSTSSTALGFMLNGFLTAGTMRGYTYVPNIVDIDINLITDNNGFTKLNECLYVPPSSPSSNRTAALVAFFLIVFFTLLMAFAAIRLSPKK